MAPVQAMGNEQSVNVDPIRIEGLKDLQRALKEMDGESQKMLRVAFNEAAEIVAEGARRNAGRDKRSGKAQKSIRAASGQRNATVRAGGAKVPYFGFADFGGRVGIHKSVDRPFIREGRYLYPSLMSNRPEVLQVMTDELRNLATDAGLAVT